MPPTPTPTVLLAVLFLVALPAGGTEDTPPAAAFDAADYYPLAVGNVWIWSGRGPADIRVKSVVGMVESPAGITWEMETRSRDGSLRSRDFVVYRDGLIYRRATVMPDGGRIDYQPPILYGPFSAREADEREMEMQVLITGAAARSYLRRSVTEKVGRIDTSLAGFDDTIAVSFAEFPDPDFPMAERKLTVWFARGFGPVQLHVKNLAGGAEEEVLYARIGGREFGADPRAQPIDP